MPEMDGLGVAKVIRECHGNMPILPLRGYPKELPKELQDIVDASVTKGQNPEVLLGEMQRLTGGAKKPPAPEIIAKSVDYLKKKQSSK
jgi:CheY-like chemotaxis protein